MERLIGKPGLRLFPGFPPLIHGILKASAPGLQPRYTRVGSGQWKEILPSQAFQCTYVLGLFKEVTSPLPNRASYLFLVSASLLLSSINIIVLPPSRTTGYLSLVEPDNSFESGTFNRCRSCIILYSNVSFFIADLFKIHLFQQDTDNN